jgi:Uma2 family endonuclease
MNRITTDEKRERLLSERKEYPVEMITIPRRPPHEDGRWHADDLNQFDFPSHTEIIEGQLVLMMSPQRHRHVRAIDAIRNQLESALGEEEWIVDREMAVVVDEYNVPEPDVVVVRKRPEYGPKTTRYRAEDVVFAVEVESPATWREDRGRKKELYAKAGIGDYLIVSEDHQDGLRLDWWRLDGEVYRHVKGQADVIRLTEPWSVTVNLGGI